MMLTGNHSMHVVRIQPHVPAIRSCSSDVLRSIQCTTGHMVTMLRGALGRPYPASCFSPAHCVLIVCFFLGVQMEAKRVSD